MFASSNTVNLDFFLGCDTLLDKEHGNGLSEVTLQLYNETLLLIFDHGTVTMEHLFEGTEELLIIEVIGETLDDGQTLTGGTLLIVQVYK